MGEPKETTIIQPALEAAARAFIAPLGYPADVKWERVFVGNIADDHNTGSLKHLCFELARAAFNVPSVGIDRECAAINLLEQLGQEGGQWVAVRVRDGGWEIVRPSSQDAILAACAAQPAPVEQDVERVIGNASFRDDPEFVAAWQKLEAGGFMYSDGNVEKVYMGWQMARLKAACNHRSTHIEGWETVCDSCGVRYAADGGA